MNQKSSKIQKETANYKLIWRNPIYFLAFGFGAGKIAFAPGTFGTIAALPLYLVIVDFSVWMYLFTVLILFLCGIYICDVAEKAFGVKDNPGIVWDEITGILFALCLVPFSLNWIIYTFILFRIIDIFKPWPIKLVETKVKGGFAIMLDDLVAGLFTWLIVQFTMLIV